MGAGKFTERGKLRAGRHMGSRHGVGMATSAPWDAVNKIEVRKMQLFGRANRHLLRTLDTAALNHREHPEPPRQVEDGLADGQRPTHPRRSTERRDSRSHPQVTRHARAPTTPAKRAARLLQVFCALHRFGASGVTFPGIAVAGTPRRRI